jgi:hypothetical protein
VGLLLRVGFGFSLIGLAWVLGYAGWATNGAGRAELRLTAEGLRTSRLSWSAQVAGAVWKLPSGAVLLLLSVGVVAGTVTALIAVPAGAAVGSTGG